MKEEYAVVLDYLPMGRPWGSRSGPLVQLMGTLYYTLLEATPKKGADIKVLEKVYIGKEEREKIGVIKGRIRFEDLSSVAQSNLEDAVKRIVLEREKEYVDFFNKAKPITIRLHSLELLPGIGKKHMYAILEEREKKPFESFEDIKKRIPLIRDPAKCIAGRILEEIKTKCKYYLFVRPPRER